jgi:DNA polymerase-3 subunit beta
MCPPRSNSLTIKATNLEIGIEATLPIHLSSEWSVAVPANILLQTINLISDQKITLSIENTILSIETQNSKTDIKSIPFEDFPNIPKVTGEKISIKGDTLAYAIKTTAFAASQSSIKPELGSIYIHQKKEHTLTFVSTDSFRLMEKTIPQKGIVLSNSLLIPYKNALELSRVLEGCLDEVFLHLNENQCSVTIGNIYITSRLLSGTFPDYEQIIPKEYQVTSTILTKDIINALRKTSIFLNKFSQLSIIASGKTVTLVSQSGEYGTTKESIPATIEGGEISLNFNQRYVSEALQHIIDESILLKFAGIGRPLVVENVHDRSMRYLVMPMNK